MIDASRPQFYDEFVEASQYARTQILAWNASTRLFFTNNGGLYRMGDDGIEDIKGPPSDPEERIDDDG